MKQETRDQIIGFLALHAGALAPFVAAIIAVFLMTGCNTIAGVGADIQKSANWTAEKMSGSKTEKQEKTN